MHSSERFILKNLWFLNLPFGVKETSLFEVPVLTGCHYSKRFDLKTSLKKSAEPGGDCPSNVIAMF